MLYQQESVENDYENGVIFTLKKCSVKHLISYI